MFTPTEIAFNLGSKTKTPAEANVAVNYNFAEAQTIINSLIEYINNLSLESPEITSEQVITAVNTLKIKRTIPINMVEGQTITFDDGETLTRNANNIYVITHPFNTEKSFVKIVDTFDGFVADGVYKTENNTITISFSSDLDDPVDVIIF